MESIALSTDFYRIVFNLAVLVWAVPELLGSFSQQVRGGATARDRWSGPVARVSMLTACVGAILLAAYVPAAAIPWARLPIFWIGIALMLFGVAFRWYAIRTLGQYFTRSVATHPGQAVVQSGPYRLIRHPSYAGTLLVMLGIGLALGSWLSLILVVVLPLAGFSYRMTVEERALSEAIGQPYRDYMSRTHRLIPFVY